MESTFLSVSTSTMSILSLSKSINTPLIAHLHRRFSTTRPSQLAQCIGLSRFVHSSFVRARGPLDLRRNRLQFVANYAASSASGGGGFGGTYGNSGGGGGGGDGAADGGDFKPKVVTAGIAEAPSLGSDVIILDVSGMTCGGCAASVKRILESQPQVSSASVNLTTETAIVWPMAEAKVAPNWQKDIGEALANHLSSCGFNSNLRDQGAVDEDIQL